MAAGTVTQVLTMAAKYGSGTDMYGLKDHRELRRRDGSSPRRAGGHGRHQETCHQEIPTRRGKTSPPQSGNARHDRFMGSRRRPHRWRTQANQPNFDIRSAYQAVGDRW